MIVIRLDQKALASIIEDGGDEFKLELTAATLEGAAKRSLKTIVTGDVQKAMDKAIKKEVEAGVKEEIGKLVGKTYGYTMELTDQTKKAIRQQVKDEARKVVKDWLEEEKLEEYMDEQVKAITGSVVYYAKQRLMAITEETIKKEVEQRVTMALSGVALALARDDDADN